ncbi:MAG: hypothetical protein H5T69_13165 [Chloroflexi bacterium]|nr:hypothetical protein [Chloroflexota bacterium]
MGSWAQRNLISTWNEGSLHAALKERYAEPGDLCEAVVDGYVVDILRCDELIEVQTGHFASIKAKLSHFVPFRRVLLVYPIARHKWIVKVAPMADGSPIGERLGRRRSPKRGQILDLFDELVRIPRLAGHPNLTLDVVLCDVNEIRCNDGQGSWRRQGVSVVDQELLEVVGAMRLRTPDDFARLLPEGLDEPFTNRRLAEVADISPRLAARITYCLHKMGALERVGREGRAYLYRRSDVSF